MTENWIWLSKKALENAIFKGLLTGVRVCIEVNYGRITGRIDGNALGYCDECERVWDNKEPTPCDCYGEKGELYNE